VSDVGEVAQAVAKVTDLVANILERADRDGPEKELNENVNKVQNSFADNNLDGQWACAYRLLNSVGHPLTPGGSVGDTERQFRHNAMIAIAELKYAKQILARISGKSK
jgi:hypothetical protein